MDYATFNQVTFVFYILCALVLFYQSWMNVARRQLTKFALDTLLLAYIRLVQGDKQAKRARKLIGDEPQRLRVLGFAALGIGIVFVYLAIDTYVKYIHV